MSELIYHYCSLETFLLIIKNKTLRLSNVAKSNDVNEVKHIFLGSEDLILNLLKSNTELYNDGNDSAYKSAIKNNLEKHITARMKKLTVSHAMCFSKDGDKLSQWRGYASNACGVSIGFNLKTLMEHFNKNYIKISNITYTENAKDIISNDIDNLTKFILKNVKTHNDISLINSLCDELARYLFLDKGLVCKGVGFIEEEEVRLHTAIPSNEYGLSVSQRIDDYLKKLNLDIGELTATYDFSARNEKLVSHFDIKFEYKESEETTNVHEFIKEIVIGPKAEVSIEEMKHILLTYGLSGVTDNIVKSQTTYR